MNNKVAATENAGVRRLIAERMICGKIRESRMDAI